MGTVDAMSSHGEYLKEIEVNIIDRKLVVVEEEPENIRAIKASVKVLLEGLGEDSNREGLIKTPLRVAKALLDGTRGYKQNVNDIVQGALFPEAGLDNAVGYAGGAGGLVVVRDLNLFSICESCLLPFQVKCHVGYIPSEERVVGLSKLSRVADVFAKRLQSPQRLADEVCSGLQSGIRPDGVAVVLQCWHIHSPEVEINCTSPHSLSSKQDIQGWEKILVSSSSGILENQNGDFWVDFTSLLKFRGVDVEKARTQPSINRYWCPYRHLHASCNGHSTPEGNPLIHRAPCKTESPLYAMQNAVSMMIQSLGDDPSRKELLGTPHRFVQWLMNYKKCDLESHMKMNGGGSVQVQDEFWSELNIPLQSLCEHHLLPFHGMVHVGYFHSKGAEPIKRSTLQSIVNFFGCKLQVQERLSRQIAETISLILGGDIMVVVEANHICMISRGIEKVGSSTATIAALGRFSNGPTAKATFLHSISNATSA
ncbi:hypothetical protein C5167_021201 [Papaver somniferum]|uniref:GTP cyclohydrolase 1 n=1 Tax=Papaver somniferum TaxID=3469 RepID=A0A4Y7IZ52_PAPSO|nr:GTP cyclohydrolase 1-like [Papaver somniferum]RZC52778.1 hypothetical protein C5167_021201 [Papaver somniferum]